MLLLAACEPTAGPRPASPTTYPDLATVPPRPVLTDTVQQRRSIQTELVAARQTANRRAAELAYATGRGPEPPPLPAATPPAPAGPPAERQPPGGDGAIARAYLDNSLNDIRDRGKLRQFMRRLGREAPDPVGPQSLAQAVGLASPPPAAEAAPSEIVPSTSVGDYLWGVFGFGDDDGPPL